MYCLYLLFCNVGFCQSVLEMCCAGGAFIFMTPNRKNLSILTFGPNTKNRSGTQVPLGFE